MTPMRSVLVWALVVVLIGLAIWQLLARDNEAGVWLLAAFLAGHGFVHLLIFVPAPEGAAGTWAFDLGHSWSVTRLGVGMNTVRLVSMGLVGFVVAGFALAALSTLGLLVPAEWWRAVVGASALVSTALLVICFNRQLVVGLGIDIGLLWVALAGRWMP